MTTKGQEEPKKAASPSVAKGEKEKEKGTEEKGQQQKGPHQERERPKREKKEKETGTGVVKSVLSGDRLVIYVDGPKNQGPTWRAPEEKEIKLSNLKAPLPASKRDTAKGKREEEDWCWHSKDFLRKLAVGKRVEYQIDFVPASNQQGGRVYGTVKLLPEKGKREEAVDLSQEVVAAGWAAVSLPGGGNSESNSQREDKKDNRSEYLKSLVALEDAAKAGQLGIFAKDPKVVQHAHVQIQKPFKIRTPSDEEEDSEGEGTFDATRAYKEWRGQTLDGVVEHVHNGSMLRVLLLPSFREILLKIAGVQSPIFKRKPASDEPFAQQSQHITERNILQRDVKVHLTAFEQQRSNDTRGEPTFYGELLDNNVSIGEKLLEAGLARFVEWSSPKEKVASLRALEEAAQKTRKGIWQHEQVPQGARAVQTKLPTSFVGKVIEVQSGGNITVLNQATTPPTPVTVTLSSVNVPRLGHGERDDDFFAWDAREFVRKKLLGKKVQVVQDYIRPAVTVEEKKGKKSEGNEKKEEKVLPPKPFYTVTHEGKNVALGLVELGYAELLEHRGQDRSPHYDALFLAQERARSKKLGLHGNPESFIRHRVHDLSRSTQAAKRLYKSLETKEGQKHKAIVEYVISGSRLKLCLPDQSCLITFFLGGARCPSVGGRKQSGEAKPVDPVAVEAREFTNSLLLHRDVEIAIDGQDKTGAFRGHLWFKKKNNLAFDLISKGLAEFSGMGRNTASKDLEAKYIELEDKAKEARLGIWKNYDPKAEAAAAKAEKEPEEVEASAKPLKELISVTEVVDGSHFYFHILGEEQKRLEALMEKLQAAGLEGQTPYPPERGDVVATRFSDGQWYRAQVTSVKGNTVNVFYADYGNTDSVTPAEIRQLPAEFGLSELRWQALEGGLAYIQTRSPEDEWGQEAAIAFRDLVWGKTMLATMEYKDKGVFFLLLAPSDNSIVLVNSELCRLGLAKMQRRIPRNANEKIIEWIRKDQEDAHKNHRGIFEYGDDGEEDEFEDRRQAGRGQSRRGK